MSTRLERNLRENSIEGFILALEVINKLSISYRVESFAFLFCNAWELLLKAKLLREKRKIFYPKKRNQPRRSLTLDDCLNRVFTAEEPVRINIEKVAELRNAAIHLVIPFIPADVIALFQAGVINYAQKLNEWFGIDLTKRIPLGMMTLVYDIDPSLHALDSVIIKRKLPKDTIEWWKRFQNTIRDKAESLTTGKEAFYRPLTFRLAIVKNPNKADIVLDAGTGSKEVIIVEMPKNPDITHPYRRKDVVELVNQRLNGRKMITPYDVLCVRTVSKIDDSKPNYYYKSKFTSPQYSGAFVDWLVEQFEKNNMFFEKSKAKYKEITQR